METNLNSLQTQERFMQNKTNVVKVAVFLAINILNWAYIFFVIKPQSDPIYLHYNIYFGVDLIGQWYRMYVLPSLGLVFGGINFIFARVIHKKNTVISSMILWVTIFMQLIILLSTYLIIRQN